MEFNVSPVCTIRNFCLPSCRLNDKSAPMSFAVTCGPFASRSPGLPSESTPPSFAALLSARSVRLCFGLGATRRRHTKHVTSPWTCGAPHHECPAVLRHSSGRKKAEIVARVLRCCNSSSSPAEKARASLGSFVRFWTGNRLYTC